jgi:hypothetical protein
MAKKKHSSTDKVFTTVLNVDNQYGEAEDVQYPYQLIDDLLVRIGKITLSRAGLTS